MIAHLRRTCVAVGLVWTVVASASSAQQSAERDAARPPSTGTASLAGTVVADDEAHTPMPKVVVSLSMAGMNGQRTVATDAAGRYVFPNLPAAAYTITAARGAYLTTAYGALAPGAPPLPIPLKDGQRFDCAPIVLVRGSVIAGRIADTDGRPLASPRVIATRVETTAGVRRPVLGTDDRGFSAVDSRGFYRIYGLPAGDYVVAVVGLNAQPTVPMSPAAGQWVEAQAGARAAAPVPPPPPARPFVSAPTYFPSVADLADATLVSLGRAEERQGIDITVLRVSTAQVTGTVYGLEGQAAPNVILLRSQKHVSDFMSGPLAGQARSRADGTFTMTGVMPGEYVITARAPSPSTTVPVPAANPALSLPSGPLTLWGQAEVSANGEDVEGVAIHLQPAMTISGSIVFEGTAPSPTNLTRFQPRLVAIDDSTPTVTINQGPSPAARADGTFALDVMPGSYLLTASGDIPVTSGAPPAWTVKSVVAGDRDLLNAPFEVRPREDVKGVVVTYSDRHTELNGQLTDATGQPVSQFRVLVFATNRERWMPRVLPRWMASVRAGADGSFRIAGLPPGEYYVCAFVDRAQPPTPDEALLTSLVPASIKITLAEGETRTQTFKVGG